MLMWVRVKTGERAVCVSPEIEEREEVKDIFQEYDDTSSRLKKQCRNTGWYVCRKVARNLSNTYVYENHTPGDAWASENSLEKTLVSRAFN